MPVSRSDLYEGELSDVILTRDPGAAAPFRGSRNSRNITPGTYAFAGPSSCHDDAVSPDRARDPSRSFIFQHFFFKRRIIAVVLETRGQTPVVFRSLRLISSSLRKGQRFSRIVKINSKYFRWRYNIFLKRKKPNVDSILRSVPVTRARGRRGRKLFSAVFPGSSQSNVNSRKNGARAILAAPESRAAIRIAERATNRRRCRTFTATLRITAAIIIVIHEWFNRNG